MNPIFTEQNDMFTAWRRTLHQQPELGFEEQQTAQFIAHKLKQWSFDEVHTQIATTGVVGVLKGHQHSSRAIGLRADMDALQLQEQNHFRHCSAHAGKMHACGHDGHTTMLLAAAWYLAKYRDFAGTVYFIFQPAEEGLAGAKAMLDDGLFQRFPCDRIYAMHNMPGIPQGEIWLRQGAILASSARFTIEITGKGGHGAMPQHVVDPSLIASSIILSAQSIVSRNIDPLESAVVSFTDLHAGAGTFNVIPHTAMIKGCIRSFCDKQQTLAITRLQQIIEHTAQSYGGTAQLTTHSGNYPATINDANATAIAAEAAKNVVGSNKVNDNCQPLAGSEDFSFMLQQVPGCYLLLGNGAKGEKGGISVHNPHYDFNDEIIPTGASLLVELVNRELKAH